MVVQANESIRVLDLSENEIGDAGMLPLGDALKVDFVLFREISSFALLLLPVTQLSCHDWLSRLTKRSGHSSCVTTKLGPKEYFPFVMH